MQSTTIYKNGVAMEDVLTCDKTNYTALQQYLEENDLPIDNMDEGDEGQWYCLIINGNGFEDIYSTYY